MKFRTEIPVIPSKHSLQYDHRILSLGSCFADHVVERLNNYKFNTTHNPFGTTYNPLSLADQLNAIRTHRSYSVVDIEKTDRGWVSFDHHGSFTHQKAQQTVEAIDESLTVASSSVGSYKWTILSLGTAWAWFLDNKVVNNCHHLPESHFDFRMLSIDEMTEILGSAIQKWNEANPENTVLITVSPVRHIRSGLIENNRSKARLIEVAHQLAEQLDKCVYYPAYELVLDDLRDYRFFEENLTHPSQQAVQYVWEHFQATFMNQHTMDVMESFEGFRKALYHRPRQTEGPAFTGHLQSLEKKFYAWVQRWPDADWEEEKRRWNELLNL